MKATWSGPLDRGEYRNFIPVVANFLTDDVQRLDELKGNISDDEWRRAEEMGQSYLKEKIATPRDGRPFWCWLPADKAQIPSEWKLENLAKETNVNKQEPITILEAPKRILLVILFTTLTLWSVKEALTDSKYGWIGVAIFGSMLAYSIAIVFHLSYDLPKKVSLREAGSFKAAYTGIVIFAASLLLGLVGELVRSDDRLLAQVCDLVFNIRYDRGDLSASGESGQAGSKLRPLGHLRGSVRRDQCCFCASSFVVECIN